LPSAETAARRGRNKRPKTDRADARHLRELLMVDRMPESWIPPEQNLGAAVSAAGRVRAGALPAGRYATLLHVGPYNSTKEPDLASARAKLLRWAEQQDIELERSRTDRGTRLRALRRTLRHGPVPRARLVGAGVPDGRGLIIMPRVDFRLGCSTHG